MINNDWIVANINNPDTSPEMLKTAGFNTDNTLLLDEDKYLKSNFITLNPMFQKNGLFDKDLFDTYYKLQVTKWKDLQTDKQVHQIYDMFDVRQNPGDTTLNPLTGDTKGLRTDKEHPFGTFLQLTPNFTNQGISVSGFNQVSPLTKSIREIAEGLKIFDSSANKFTNDTPDGIALFSNPVKYFKLLFSDPLVLATYDSEGWHYDPYLGKQVKHEKGDYKLNSDGKPYYETLNGRNPANKLVLSMGDILTSETSAINKYDFIDSDDMDKSIGGTILKNIATAIPMAIPYVGEIYSGALVTRELAKSAPMLWGIIKSVFSDEPANSPVLNTILGYAQQFTGSSSDAANNNKGFTWENMLNMMGDVALQWGLQQAVAKLTRKVLSGNRNLLDEAEKSAKALYDKKLASILDGVDESKRTQALMTYGLDEDLAKRAMEAMGKPTDEVWKMTSIGNAALRKSMDAIEPLLKRLNRIGANASLAYMAAVSNTDVYLTMLDSGASPREAAAVAFGSTLGMYTVDRRGIGELFFDELRDGKELAIRSALKKGKDEWVLKLGLQVRDIPEDANLLKKLIIKGRNKTAEVLKNYADDIRYHTTGFFGKAIGEGLEEVSEELVTDMSKSVYEMLYHLGISSQSDVGAWNYDKNLNGGEGGYDIGALLSRYGMNFLGGALGGSLFYGVGVIKGNNYRPSQNSGDMLYLVREGKGQEMISRILKMLKDGKLGSTTISASKVANDEDNNPVNITIDGDLSINDYIAKRMINLVLAYQTIMDDNNLSKNDDELFNHMIMQDKIFRLLSGFLLDKSYVTRYLLSWHNLANQVVIAEKGLLVALQAKNGEIPRDILAKLGTSSSAKDLIEELGDARLLDTTSRHDLAEELKRHTNVTAWLKYLLDKKLELSNFESPENSSYYTEMLMFALDPITSSAFGSYDFNSWLYNNHHGLTALDVTPQELEQLKADYNTYTTTELSMELEDSFKLYKDWLKKINPKLADMQLAAQNFDSLLSDVEKLFKDGSSWWAKSTNPDLQQFWESDEEFNDIKQREGESDADYLVRKNERLNKIKLKTDEKLLELVDFVNTHVLDPVTNRLIRNMFLVRTKDLRLSEMAKVFNLLNQTSIYSPIILELFVEDLKNFDGKDLNQLKKNLTTKVQKYFEKMFSQIVSPYEGFNEETFLEIKSSNIFGTQNSNSFGNLVVKDLLKLDTDKLSNDSIERMRLVNELTGFIYDLSQTYNGPIKNNAGESYAGKTVEYILRDIYGDEVVDNIKLSIESATHTYTDGEGNSRTYTFKYINPWKYIGKGQNITKEDVDNWIEERKDISNTSLKILEKWSPNINGTFDEVSKATELDIIKTLIDDSIDAILNNLADNKIFLTLSNLTDSLPNPITELAKTLPIYNSTVEGVIKKMYEHFEDVENPSKFLLTPEEQLALPQVNLVLNFVVSYVNAASSDLDIYNIYGHNKTINRFNKEHNIQSEPLAEIDKRYADIYLIELSKYMQLIDPDYLGLPYLSNLNLGNILEQFNQTKTALDNTKKEFWRLNRNNFVVNNINLLEGYSEDMTTREIENLVYDNAQLLSVLDLATIVDLFSDNIIGLETTKLNANISYNTFSNYDKITYLISTLGIKTDNFLSFLKDEINKYNNIVPIDAQIYLARIGIAALNNPTLVDAIFDRLKTKANIKIPTLNRLLFINGIGGCGKTSVIVKYIKDFAGNKKLIAACPTNNLKGSLNSSLGITDALNAEELMALVVDKATYDTLNTGLLNSEDCEGLDVPLNSVTVKPSDAKILILDETTHFSTLDLALLNKWANKNNIQIFGVGDDTQSGYLTKKMIANVDSDNAFCLRSPSLAISLRNANILLASDTTTLYTITLQIKRLVNNRSADKFKECRQALATFKPRYTTVNDLLGTMFTDNFDDVKYIPRDANVAYIGSKDITDKFPNAKKFESIKDILGLEFAYVIYDLGDIKAPKEGPYSEEAAGDLLLDARKLYTIISRGLEGVLIVLQNSGYSNTEEFYTGQTTNFKDYAELLRNQLLSELDSYNLNPTAPSSSTTTTTSTASTTSTTSTTASTSSTGTSTTSTTSSSTTTTTPPKTVDEALDDTLFSMPVPIDLDGVNTLLQLAASRNSAFNQEVPNENLLDRCYANVSLLGLTRDPDKNWIIPTNTNSFSDIGVVADVTRDSSKPKTVTDGSEKDDLVRELLKVKQSLLSAKRNDTGERWKGEAFLMNHPEMLNYFTADEFDNLKFYAEIRPRQDLDHLVGLTTLGNNKLSFNYKGQEVVALVTAEWTHNGKNYKITLGGLPNPNSDGAFALYARTHTGTTYEKYTQLFDAIVSEGGKREINTPNNMLTILHKSNTLIPFLKVSSEQEWTTRSKKTVKGTLSNADNTPHAALKDRGYLSVSDPLIYMNGISGMESMQGLVVYLVSSIPNMTTLELVDMYIQNKLDSSADNLDRLKVRMIAPTQRGLSFLDMTNEIWRLMYVLPKNETLKANNFPLDAAVLGLRMYARLWNTRANLLNILLALDNNPNTNLSIYNLFRLLDPSLLDNKNLKYYIGWDTNARDKEFAAYLRANTGTSYSWDYKATGDLKRILDKFVDYLNNLKERTSTGEPNEHKLKSYIYATKEYMLQILAITEASLAPFNELIKLKKADGSDFDIHQTITTDKKDRNDLRRLFAHGLDNDRDFEFTFPTYDDNGVRQDISVLLHLDALNSDRAVYASHLNNVKYNSWSLFKMVPIILTKNYRIVSISKSKNKDLWKSSDNAYSYKYKDSSGKEQVLKLPTQPLLDEANKLSSMTDFTNIMDLIFHGTTDVLGLQSAKAHGVKGVNHYNFRESSAPFRYGIWTFPLIDYENGEKLITRTTLNSRGLEYFKRVRMGTGTNNVNSLFMSDVEPIAIADISLEKRSEKISKPTTPEPVAEDPNKEIINDITKLGLVTSETAATVEGLATAHNRKLKDIEVNNVKSNSAIQGFFIKGTDGNYHLIDIDKDSLGDEANQVFNMLTGKMEPIYVSYINNKRVSFTIDLDGVAHQYQKEENDDMMERAWENKEVRLNIYDEFKSTVDLQLNDGINDESFSDILSDDKSEFRKDLTLKEFLEKLSDLDSDDIIYYDYYTENKSLGYLDNMINKNLCVINII